MGFYDWLKVAIATKHKTPRTLLTLTLPFLFPLLQAEPSLSLSSNFSVTMLKASFKGKYDTDNDNSGGACFLAANAGDVKLRASMTEATFRNGPSLTGLTLSIEKPGSFIVDYNVPKKDVRFQFMNTVRVLEKTLNLTYMHARGENRTALDGTLVIDSSNKMSANYAFDSGNCKVKYNYVHGGLRTFEPCYDFAKNSWDFALSQKVYDDDVFRASYQTSSKMLGLEWSRSSKFNGAFKISASLNLAEELKMPKLSAEILGTPEDKFSGSVCSEAGFKA